MKIEGSKSAPPAESKQVAETKKRETELEAQNQAKEQQEAKPEEKPALATA